MSEWQTVENHIAAEWPVVKAFIATHPYFCTAGAFILGAILGHLI